MNIKFLHIVFLLLAQTGLADEIWIRSPEIPTSEFLAKVNLSPRSITWSEWWIKNRISEPDIQSLEKRLALAQSEFLKGGIERAIELFRAIVELENSADWKLEQRRSYAYSHLRLAQMAGDRETRDQEILAASKWGDVPVREDLFPITIISDYKRKLQTRIKERMEVDLWFPESRFILVDGLPIEVKAGTEVFIDSLKHRFTLVYDHRPEATFVGSWGELKKWNPPELSYVSGTCDNPVWQIKPLSIESLRFAFKDNCNLKWRQSQEKLSVSRNIELPTQQRIPEPVNVKSGENWLWYAGGIVAIGLLIASQRDNSPASTPTTTVGF